MEPGDHAHRAIRPRVGKSVRLMDLLWERACAPGEGFVSDSERGKRQVMGRRRVVGIKEARERAGWACEAV